MKKFIVIASAVALVVGMSSCVSSAKKADAAPAAAPAAAPEAKVLDEAVGPTTANTLATTAGSVQLVWKQDVSKASPLALKGATCKVVEYLGKKCIQVTPNYSNEIRFSFVFDKAVKLDGYKTISYSVAGFEGGEGAYNCGVMFSPMNGGEHKAAFYLSNISRDAWTDVKADLVNDEKWNKNFNTTDDCMAIQFWSGSSKPIYIADMALSK
jgi:hypothetical protein